MVFVFCEKTFLPYYNERLHIFIKKKFFPKMPIFLIFLQKKFFPKMPIFLIFYKKFFSKNANFFNFFFKNAIFFNIFIKKIF